MIDPRERALNTDVFVSPSNNVRGVHAPGYRPSYCLEGKCVGPHTCDWRAEPGSAENLHAVKTALVRTPLRAALSNVYVTEAHVAAYMLTQNGESFARQPRIRKDSLPWLRAQGFEVFLTCFMADWDTPGHQPWTPGELARLNDLWSSASGPLATCGLYLSPKGARLMQPLEHPLVVEEGEGSLRTWLDLLVAAGVDPGVTAVKDWTRLMRVPHHRRDSGERVHSPRVDLSRIVPIEAPPPTSHRTAPKRRSTPRPAPGGASVSLIFTDRVPAGWEVAADAIGAAIRDSVGDGRYRQCYLSLSGALAERGCPLDGLPAVVGRAHSVDRSYPEWESVLQDRVGIARDTAAHFLNRESVLGYNALRAQFPRVADALDATTASPAEARVRRQLAAPAPTPGSVESALATLDSVFLRAARGSRSIVAVAAPPGTGKTHGTVQFASRLPVIATRAAPGSRVAVSSPRHDLARQTASKLPGRALHVFSPPSMLRPDGTPVCIYADVAKHLAAGRQSVRRELCDGRNRSPCELAQTCPARNGVEGDERGNLVVGVHGLVRDLRAYAGTRGVLVVDEPGEITVVDRVTLDDLEVTRRQLGDFVPRYATAIAPLLAAFRAWVETLGPVEAPITSVHDAVRAAANAVPCEVLDAAGIDPDTAASDLGDAILVAAHGAISGAARSKAPPLEWRTVVVSRGNPARAAEVGRVSRVLDLLWRAVVSSVVFGARIDERSGERAASVVSINEDLACALEHEGSVVVLDANAALHVAAITRVMQARPETVGGAPDLVEIAVDDGAPILRTVLACGSANRTAWMPRGVPDWEAGITSALRSVVAWMNRVPWCRSVGFIAPLVIEAAIAHTLRPNDPKPVSAWPHSKKSLDAARKALDPILKGFDGEIVTGHYGALEGLDFMARCDATVTFMDPRPNLGDEQLRAEYLGLDAEGRVDDLAAAELEQAHGRLRTIHRTKPGRQLHVGVVVPHGWAGRAVEIETITVGRPKGVAAMSAEEFTAARAASGLSQAAFARSIRASVGAVKHYEHGRAPVPDDVARAVRALSIGGSETPIRESPTGVSDPVLRYGGF